MKPLAALFALTAIAGAVMLAIPGRSDYDLLLIVLAVIGFSVLRLLAWAFSKS
jgi:hypothetical protein